MAALCPEVSHHALHLPIQVLKPGQAEGARAMRVLRLCRELCRVLTSKERAPYVVVAEVLQTSFRRVTLVYFFRFGLIIVLFIGLFLHFWLVCVDLRLGRPSLYETPFLPLPLYLSCFSYGSDRLYLEGGNAGVTCEDVINKRTLPRALQEELLRSRGQDGVRAGNLRVLLVRRFNDLI